jgi:hypothetical protein
VAEAVTQRCLRRTLLTLETKTTIYVSLLLFLSLFLILARGASRFEDAALCVLCIFMYALHLTDGV